MINSGPTTGRWTEQTAFLLEWHSLRFLIGKMIELLHLRSESYRGYRMNF